MCEPSTIMLGASLALTAAGTAANAYGAQQQRNAMNSAAASADARMAQIINQNSQKTYQAQIAELQRNRDLMNSENERQGQLKQQAQATQDEQARKNSTESFNKAQQDEASRLQNVYSPVADNALNLQVPVIATGTNFDDGAKAVDASTKNSLSNVSDYLRKIGNARANMEAFGSAMQNQQIGSQQAGDYLNKLQQLSNYSGNAYNQEHAGSENISQLTLNNLNQNAQLEQGISNRQAETGYYNASLAGQNSQTLGSLLNGAGQVAGMGASYAYGKKMAKCT